LDYQYEQQKISAINNAGATQYYKYEASNYSTSLFLMYFILGRNFIRLEPGASYTKVPTITFNPSTSKFAETSKRVIVPSVLVGLGHAFPIGENNIFVIRVMYDVLQDKNSPYSKLPFVRGGFNFGL
jgi:hypothetical protein